MFEKVNPEHPDKIADRIAGAIVDEAYQLQEDPRIAVEVLIGHGVCAVIAETSVHIPQDIVRETVERISRGCVREIRYRETEQDAHLAENQRGKMRCGDNGIFRGVPVSTEEIRLGILAREIYRRYHTDGKYILDEASDRLIICQSGADRDEILRLLPLGYMQNAEINPLGPWTGGTYVDTGATNRKLGSDMGQSVTGGGLHGKDLSKADVSVNIYAWLKAQEKREPVELCCAIGDETVDGKTYAEIVETARNFIRETGGFEEFAAWGLI